MAAATWTGYMHTKEDLSGLDVSPGNRKRACRIMVSCYQWWTPRRTKIVRFVLQFQCYYFHESALLRGTGDLCELYVLDNDDMCYLGDKQSNNR